MSDEINKQSDENSEQPIKNDSLSLGEVSNENTETQVSSPKQNTDALIDAVELKKDIKEELYQEFKPYFRTQATNKKRKFSWKNIIMMLLIFLFGYFIGIVANESTHDYDNQKVNNQMVCFDTCNDERCFYMGYVEQFHK